ncbi:hypothetical protein [Bombella apis]|uniref:Uncharacterized protein n=1 Tax=Bombella apis TaxID=1785988 RepID=A0ABR9MRH7_9PROT|nr:hypothetical protein [Bombella apis]MBE1723976.1 hypothetical protein [Bombella apis]MBR9730315.1 hypothetical protein [Bombella apis]
MVRSGSLPIWFSLISALPDTVTGWFGTNTQNRGESEGMREFMGLAIANMTNCARTFTETNLADGASNSAAAHQMKGQGANRSSGNGRGWRTREKVYVNYF